MNKKEMEDRMRIDPEFRQKVAKSILETDERENPERAKIEIGKCYEEIIEVIDYYMDIPLEHKKIIAVWIIGTYFHDSFSTYPFLFINAMRGSGKTRLLNIISHLSKGSNGKVQTGITEAVLFRTPKGKTMVLDECESLGSKDKAILREYLNACYKKGGVVERAKKNKDGGYDIETFSPYKPIVMANIFGLEEILQDRCISLILEKSNNPSVTKKVEDFDTNPIVHYIKRTLEKIFSVVSGDLVQLVQYAQNPSNPQKQALQALKPQIDDLVQFRPEIYKTAWNQFICSKYSSIGVNTTLTTLTTLTTQPTLKTIQDLEMERIFNKIDEIGVDGRNFELLFPLLIISNSVDFELFEEILLIGKNIMESKKEEEVSESRDVSVYEFVANCEGEGFVSMKELTQNFKIWLGEVYNEHINDWWMGKALKRLNIILDKRRLASGIFVILNKEKAKEKLKIFKVEE